MSRQRPGEGSARPTGRGDRGPLFHPGARLVGYCLLVGALGAVAALAFGAAVEAAEKWFLHGLAGYRPPGLGGDLTAHVPRGWARAWIPLTTTLGGLASGFLVYRWAPEAEGHGTDAAIAAYHRGGQVRGRVPLVKGVASALTIGSGGVAGREGPTAQIVVGLGSLVARATGLRGEEKRHLLLAAMAAGLAAMFRAPLGMAIFTVEILYAGMVFESEALIYTVISAVTAYALFGVFAGWESLFEIPAGLTFHQPPALAGFALLGVLAGLLGALLPALLYGSRRLFARLPGPPHLRPAVGGLAVGLVAVAAPEVLGTGYGFVELAILGQLGLGTALLLLLLKGPAMAVTIGSGGAGGVFAPTVTLGGMLGAVVGLTLGPLVPGPDLPVAAWVVVGMAAVFAGAARTPISTLIMVAEMTGGYGLIVPAMLTNVVAFLVQRRATRGSAHPTLYESQVETREDSPLHRGVFVRRALEMLEGGTIDASEFRLPRLVSLLAYGEPIRVGDGQAKLVSLTVADGSELAGRTVAESIGAVEGATAVAVLREEEMILPRGSTLLAAGDQLLAVVTASARERLARLASAL